MNDHRNINIAVLTLHAIKNYGSVLQTLATQDKFNEFGFDVEIINYIREDARDRNLYKTWTKGDSIFLKIIKSIVLFPTIKRWKLVFESFLQKNLKLTSQTYYSEEDLKKNCPNADIYCVGSDQVWNSEWNQGFLPEFFLSFVPDDRIKISFSSSIGKSVIDETERTLINKYLSKFMMISVREDDAVKVLNEIGLYNVTRILDPTLLMPADYWMRKASCRLIKDRYILVYQLNHNKEFDKFAIRLAKRKGIKLVRICTRYDQIFLPGKAIIIPSIEDFLSLFLYADYIITDSFHGSSFALNFKKELICVYPEKFGNRLDCILKNANLLHRHLIDFKQLDIADSETDFSELDKFLIEERKKADLFLEQMIILFNRVNKS